MEMEAIVSYSNRQNLALRKKTWSSGWLAGLTLRVFDSSEVGEGGLFGSWGWGSLVDGHRMRTFLASSSVGSVV